MNQKNIEADNRQAREAGMSYGKYKSMFYHPPAQTPPEDRTPPHQRLWKIRQAAGLTILEVAQRLGTKPDVVNKWENGETRPSQANVQRLSALFGRDMSFLRKRKNPPAASQFLPPLRPGGKEAGR